MTNTEILRIYNDWRQDKTNGRVPEDYGITPRMITEALDAVARDAERYQFLMTELPGSVSQVVMGTPVFSNEDINHAIDDCMVKGSRHER